MQDISRITLEYLENTLKNEYKLYKKKHNPLTLAQYESNLEDCEWTTFNKNIANKGFGMVRVNILSESEDGIEIKISIYVPSYCDYDTFFEGWLQDEKDIHTVIRLIGI